MQKLMGSGELLDAKGHLVERGWAASEVRRYDRAAIGVAHDDPAIKEWDYYAILTPDFGLALTVADNGHMGFLGVSWMDFQARRFVNGGVGLPAPHGAMNLPSSADAGDIAHVHPKMEIAFRFAPGGRVLTVDAPDFDKGAGISGEIVLAQPPMDRMVIATPFAEQATAFYYNQKINCMKASGYVTFGTDMYSFRNGSYGSLDWGRGVWTYQNTWYWSSASGEINGHRFGFNLGYGFGDTTAASENMLFYDGIGHKIDRVEFQIPKTIDGKDDWMRPWTFTSNDHRFEAVFEPILDRSAYTNALVLKSDQNQVFGRFTGQAVLDDGTVIQLDHFLGFAEKVFNRW